LRGKKTKGQMSVPIMSHYNYELRQSAEEGGGGRGKMKMGGVGSDPERNKNGGGIEWSSQGG
jgi:hypothetical protein